MTTSDIYLFNQQNRAFMRGETAINANAVTAKKAFRQFSFLFLLVALPMIIAISLLVAAAGHPIGLLVSVEFSVALVLCIYFAIRNYYHDWVLRSRGQIVLGEVIHHDILPAFGNVSSSTITRIYYRFQIPGDKTDERIIDSVDMAFVMNRLPDGRKYPVPHTTIAILFADEQHHKLL